MKLEIYDGRANFYQWDINVKLIVRDEKVDFVHFQNTVSDKAYVCKVYVENTNRVVDVPNVLLTQPYDITAYAQANNHTVYAYTFQVYDREKPDNYIYTETEVISIDNKLDKGGHERNKILITDDNGNITYDSLEYFYVGKTPPENKKLIWIDTSED